jgi:hypothetical protein
MKRQSNRKSSERLAQLSPLGPTTASAYLYEDATGRTIDYIRYADQSNESHAFEIRFTDGTFLFIEPIPRVQFRVRYLKANDGDIKTVRDFGVVPERFGR